MKVAFYPSSSAAKYWRMFDPAKYLSQIGIDVRIVEDGITDASAQHFDVHVLHNCVDKAGIATLVAYQRERGKKLVVDCDDYPILNADNPYMMEHQLTNAPEIMKIAMSAADMVTTTQKIMQRKLHKLNPNVVVLPNLLDLERWDVQPKRKNESKRIRIGWAGSITHMKDLELIVKPLKRICDEYPEVELIFMGDTRVRDYFEGYPVEIVLGVPFEVYPQRLNGLRLDIAIAPLVKNEFNTCKSNIKWLEYSINKVPGVFSPTVYQHKGFEPKYGLVAYNEDGWYRAIQNLIEHPTLRQDIADNAYSLVRSKYSLRNGIHKWAEAYKSLFLT